MQEQNMTVRDHYLEQMVDAAGQEGLLILLVEGAVKFVRRAKYACENERYDEVSTCLIKAQNIFLELVLHLDFTAGEFAENLGYVYQYIYNLLIEANLEKNLEKIGIGLRLTEQIRDLWKETIEKARSESGEKAGDGQTESQAAGPCAIPKTGVYEPAGGSKIAEAETSADDVPSRLNLTG